MDYSEKAIAVGLWDIAPSGDASFTHSDPKKNIDDCCTFIINQVRQSGCNGFADEEIYSMALHYYDEEDIDIGKPVSCKVVVNHTVELTEGGKAEARRNAIREGRERSLRLPAAHDLYMAKNGGTCKWNGGRRNGARRWNRKPRLSKPKGGFSEWSFPTGKSDNNENHL